MTPWTNWTTGLLTSGGLLDNILQIPDEQLLRWQDGAKILRLKKQRLDGTLTEDDQDAIYVTEKSASASGSATIS